jgi:hypothetical protein
VKIVAHHLYGRADLVAKKESLGTFVIEAEGESAKQKEQAMYSAFGQIVLSMHDPSSTITYGLAVPDTVKWETQLNKIPQMLAVTSQPSATGKQYATSHLFTSS